MDSAIFIFLSVNTIQLSSFFSPDPFAVKRNVARSVSSQQMYEYIVHCLKATYKYFALPPNAPSAALKKERKGGKATAEEPLPDLGLLGIQPQDRSPNYPEENGPDDVDCIIEEEEEDEEEYSDSDEEREREKVDVGKNSVSEDEEDEDGRSRSRQHLDSFTTEEEIFPVDEISGEDVLSEEDGQDGDTSGSAEDEEEEEDEEEDDEDVELAPVHASKTSEDSTKGSGQEDTASKHKKLAYEFTKQAFTRGKVSFCLCFNLLHQAGNECVFRPPPVARGGVQPVQARWPPEERLSGRFQEGEVGASAAGHARLPPRPGPSVRAVLQ